VPNETFDGLKTFSATLGRDRNELGERVTAWLNDTRVTPIRTHVTQSSDAGFHCVTITLFYKWGDSAR